MAPSVTICPICKANTVEGHPQGRVTFYSCPRCGPFGVAVGYWDALEQWDAQKRRKLLSHLQKPSSDQDTFVISLETEQTLVRLREPRFKERISSLMRAALRRTPALGQAFGLAKDIELQRASCSFSASELSAVLEHLREKHLVDRANLNNEWQLTAEGMGYFEPQGASGFDPAQAFVAMSFGQNMLQTFSDAIEPAIRAAGYRPLRIDRKEHINRIDDEIISEIRRSRLLIADFTENKAGVYFEAGFAHGLGIPVIWSCHREDLAKLHFDVRQFNCIDWTDANDLLLRLNRRITSAVGFGPDYIPPGH